MYDIIIIGAGPAGMTAALYAARAKKKILLIEALIYGGQIVNVAKIDNYPVEPHISGFDFATKLYNQIKEYDVDFRFEKAYEIKDHKKYKEVRTNKETYQGKTIIIATGASKRKLGLEKEDFYLGKGLSYCATCDGAFFKGKEVVVVGNEDIAIEDALYLSDICEKVTVIHSKEIKDELLNQIKEKKNILLINSSVKKLIGEERLEEIELENDEVIKLDGLFVAIGQVPANEVFGDLIKIDSYGYIVAGEDCHTNVENIFVAGDNRTKTLRQLVTATSDGANAATEAIKALQKETP